MTATQMGLPLSRAPDPQNANDRRLARIEAEERDHADLYPPGFFNWLRHNAEIYNEVEARAIQVRKSGRDRFAVRVIIESVRWNTLLRDKDATFKINNNWVSGIARLVMAVNPQLQGMFELREQHGGKDE